MTFDETIAFLTEQIGRSVEAGIEVEFPGRTGTTHVGTAAGQIDAVSQGGGSGPESWYVWIDKQRLGSAIHVHRDEFVDAEIEAHPVPRAEERSESGTWWTLTIEQRNVKFDLVIYV